MIDTIETSVNITVNLPDWGVLLWTYLPAEIQTFFCLQGQVATKTVVIVTNYGVFWNKSLFRSEFSSVKSNCYSECFFSTWNCTQILLLFNLFLCLDLPRI